MVLVESKVLNTLPVGIYKEATANPSAEPRTPKAMSRVRKNGEEKALEHFTREAALAADEPSYKLHAAALKVCVIITGSHPVYKKKKYNQHLAINYKRNNFTYRQLRARKALLHFKDVPLRTRRALSP